MKLHYDVGWELKDEVIDNIVDEIEETVKQYPDCDVDDCISEITEYNLSNMDPLECDHFNMDNYIDNVREEVKHRYYDRKQKSTAISAIPAIPNQTLHSGYIQRIDDLGRVCIPKNLRSLFNLKEGNLFEIFFDNEKNIILKEYHGQN